MGEGLTLTLPSEVDYKEIELNNNLSFLISSTFNGEVTADADPEYEQFLADVWVGIVLTLMVLSCVCCMCSCLLYHKFQQWKRGVIEARNTSNLESGTTEMDLPSYTIASGLPSYQEALEQLKKVKDLKKDSSKTAETGGGVDNWVPHTPPSPLSNTSLSVVNLFQLYNNSTNKNNPTSDSSTTSTTTKET